MVRQHRAHTKKHPSRKKKALIITLITLLVILLSAALGLAYVRYSLNSAIRHIDIQLPSATAAPDVPQPEGTHPPLNFLILGSDSRSSGGDPTDWQAGGQRSDVMMLLQLSGDRQRMSAMSIPRDLWVPIPEHGEAKINAAFSFGGPQLAIQTVQDLLDIPIHHFMIVDFQSFADLTDQLGGVTIETQSGTLELNGDQALSFVRERYSLPSGDLDRVRRQQAWIQAIMAKTFQQDVLSNPTKLTAMLQTVLAHSAVDQGLNVDSLLQLGLESRSLRPKGVTFFTIPVAGIGTSPDGQSIILKDEEAIQQVGEAFRTDSVKSFVDSSDKVRSLGREPIY